MVEHSGENDSLKRDPGTISPSLGAAPSRSGPPLAADVEHVEPSQIKNNARPSLLPTPDSQQFASFSSDINSDSL